MAKRTYTENFSELTVNEPTYSLYNSSGKKVGTAGKLPEDAEEGQTSFYMKTDGSLVSKPTVSISVNEKTGNIKITAPKSILELDEFKQVIDEDQLKQYSQAYKLNKDYKITINKRDPETDKVEEKDVTIPEYIAELESSLRNIADNHQRAASVRKEYVDKYGDKAKNLTDMHIVMTSPSSKATYVPSILFDVNFFGDDKTKGNPFRANRKLFNSDNAISVDELKKIYTRSNFGRSELAGLMATIDGALRGGDWSKDDYYTDAEGNEVYNRNSATEAAKLLAFKNFVLQNDPEAKWWQQVGDNIETLALNTLYGFDRVWLNSINMAQQAGTLLTGREVQNTIKSLDEAMGNWNEQGTLVNDATRFFAGVGLIGGSILGTVSHSALWESILNDDASTTSWLASRLGEGLKPAQEVTQMALTFGEAELAAEIISDFSTISTGTRFIINMMDTVSKVALLKNMAISGVREVANSNIITQFLFDTVHDALIYDSTTLIDTLSASDQETRDYWLGQLADNLKWWAGMGLVKGSIKMAGKTTWGKAIDALLTPLINKIAANIGDKKQAFKDYFYGGDVVRALEDKLAEAVKKGQDRRANRLRRQIAQENWNELTREARRALGDIKLEWDGIKLTKKSLEEFNNLRTTVKALENGIDAYNRNISYKRQEMVGAQYDPSTGRVNYINPSLAGANIKATDFYLKLTDLAKKYNLSHAEGSLISQDMIDYMMGRYYEGLASSFAKGSTENAAKAQEALVIIRADVNRLKEALPAEITAFIDDGLKNRVYQSWYTAQNEYGMSKGLLNKQRITSYEANPIWQDNGYIPIVVQHEVSGHWIENTGRIDAVIEQDFNKLTFNVASGQHYADPELVRQSRLSNMARAEVNAQMLKAYSGFGSDATNIVTISGEETQYLENVSNGRKYLDAAIEEYSMKAFEENWNLEALITKRRRPVKNIEVDLENRSTVVASMSPQQTTDILVQKKVLSGPNAKLTDEVTRDNYLEWYDSQSSSVKKYLDQRYDNDNSMYSEDFGSINASSKKYLQEIETASGPDRNMAWDILDESEKNIIRKRVNNVDGVSPSASKIQDEIEEIAYKNHREEYIKRKLQAYDGEAGFRKMLGIDEKSFSKMKYTGPENTKINADGRKVTFRGRYRRSKDIYEFQLSKLESQSAMRATAVHEAAHGLFARLPESAKKNILIDIFDSIGEDSSKITDKIAASIDTNELLAYMTEKRFITKNGKTASLSIMSKDKKIQEHLTNLVKMMGDDSDEAKKKLLQKFRDLIIYIKAKISGVANVSTMDEFYDTLVSGRASRSLRGGVLNPKSESMLFEEASLTGFDALQTAIKNGGDDFEAGLQRAYLIGDEKFAKTSLMNEAARNLADGKDAFYQGVVLAKIKGETRNILNLDIDSFWDDMDRTLRGQVEDYVASVMKDPGAKAAMDSLAETANGAEDVARYIALRQLQSSGLDNVHKTIQDWYKKNTQKGGQLAKVQSGDVSTLENKTYALIDDIIENELNNSISSARTINPDLVDSENIYKKAKELDNMINGEGGVAKRMDDDYVMYLDDEGRQVYAKVDPAFASLFNYRYAMSKTEASVLAKVNMVTSKLFRYGTTSVNISSFGNQLFRDFGNALLVGGSWQTIKTNADNLVDVFGENIVDQIKRFDPSGYEMKQVQLLAEQTGQTLEQAAVSRELMRGAAISPTTTERTLYKDFMRDAYGDSKEGMLNGVRTKFQEIVDKYNPEELLNGKRENYLRNRVYASSLNDAMKSGYTLEQARVYAEFAMNNATTNFARQLYHMQAIADSTPYFRAAINGTKSFWRMWSLDPVGITGRITGGLILPVMFLTGASLANEEDKKVYKNLPEYQKENSLIFVLNGQVISTPIPQEIASLVAPFRQFVEYLNDANPNDFWELMMNDVLGLFPYDLQGFTAVDMDKMISDPTFFDRISRGMSRLFSQLAPVPYKSAYMLATGTDPYTGKSLRNPEYGYWNDETGSVEILDYNQNAFAKWFASLFGSSMSPELAEKIISGVFGTTGSNLLGDITALLQEGPEGWITSVAQNVGESISAPFTVPQYDLADAVWKRAVRQLTAKKNEIINSTEMQTIWQELSQEKDPEKRKKLLAAQQDLINDYQQEVGQMVTRLGSEYKGTFDRTKFAAVIQLLNFGSDPHYQSGSQYSSNLASDSYWDSRDAAIRTMADLGVTGTSDMSIFGYLTLDRDGKVVMRYSSPVAILDMKSQWQNQNDINAANIKAILSSNNVYDAHKSVSTQIQKIYDSKSKLTNQDYANIEAIQINWNAQLAKTIAPYVSRMTPEAAINNTEVLNLLYPYVEVPGSWEKNNRGKSVSLGSRGNKKKAYYDSWIKSMFSVNDKYKGQY